MYAVGLDKGPDREALRGDHEADVAILGGGITGLSTALHLAGPNRQVTLIEAHHPGWGASGRNGGQVNPGLKREPSEVVGLLGRERGERLVRAAGGAPDYLFRLVARHGIACEAAQSGTIRVVRSAREADAIACTIADWAERGAEFELCTRDRLAALIGSPAYAVGFVDRRGGSLNPLAYSLGLAAAASLKGARIFSRSPTLSLSREGDGWRLRTAFGSVRAQKVVLATNGYTDGLWPGLRRTLVPAHSAIAATAPLPPELAAAILPGRQVVYESTWRVLYFRIDAAGRLLMGGPSALTDAPAPRHYRHLMAHAEAIFPRLRGVTWSHLWNGRVAITAERLPHLHMPAPGLVAALGYSGRGVAMATTMGRVVAELLAGRPAEDLDMPVSPIEPIRFHALWRPVVRLRRLAGATRDLVRGQG